ncbi:MAG: class I SAM-dependent methyltransferase [candidate division WOR-3 bacterium]
MLGMKATWIKDLKGLIYTKIIGPLRYKAGDGYNAQKFWSERFKRYGVSLKAAGNVNLTEQENIEMYEKSVKTLLDLFKNHAIMLKDKRVLEIGCGTGYYTKLMSEMGVADYTGLDITDTLFSILKQKFPSYSFVCCDITKKGLDERFDIILMLNVIEHIVSEKKLKNTLMNVDNSLIKGGLFIVGALLGETKKHTFYVKYWTLNDVMSRLPRYEIVAKAPFQNGEVVILKKM